MGRSSFGIEFFLTCLTQDGSKSDLLNYEKRQRINDDVLRTERLKGYFVFISHKKFEDIKVEIIRFASNGDPRLIAEVHCLHVGSELMTKR